MTSGRPLAPFLDLVRPDSSGCWIWLGSTNRFTGYTSYGNKVYAHRYSYEMFVGPIPDGYEIDHLCRVKNCVNPEHLEAVTGRENLRRQAAAATPRTVCRNGHEYAKVGFRIRHFHGVPFRYCEECNKASSARSYANVKAKRRAARMAKAEVTS